MSKTEFLEMLRRAISGKMQNEKVTAHLRYYEEYIDSQIRSGRSEREVLEELGDPRLIARTLLDTDVPGGTGYDGGADFSGTQEQSQGYSEEDIRERHVNLNSWYSRIILAIVVVLVLFILVTILKAVLPFFLILGLILYVMSYFRKR